MITAINPALHEAAHLVTFRVIQSLAVGSLVAMFAGMLLARSRWNAGTRFAIWFSSLIAIAAVPIIGGEWLGSANPNSSALPTVTLPDSLAFYIFAGWAVIALWLLIGVARSVWHLRAIRKSCVEIDMATMDHALRETLRRHRGKRKFALCTSTQVRVPTALGLVEPAVIIPNWLMQELSAEELNQILLHELAHLQRWDDWTNLTQQLVKALFFFHPAVWWIEKEVALEREMACDDVVLAETGRPRAYAECLARLAEKSFVQRSVVLAQAALGKLRQTTLRVSRILDPDRPTVQTRALKPAVSLIAVFAVGCGVWSARASRIIGFEDGVTTAQNSVASQESMAVPKFGAKIVPASVRSSQPAGVTPAKLNLRPVPSKHLNYSAQMHSPTTRPALLQQQLVHSAKAKVNPVPVTETLFVVIENQNLDSVGGSAYQIQMWRLTVFHTVINSASTQISRKQT